MVGHGEGCQDFVDVFYGWPVKHLLSLQDLTSAERSNLKQQQQMSKCT